MSLGAKKETVGGVLCGVIAQCAVGGVDDFHVEKFVVGDAAVPKYPVLEVFGFNCS